MRPLVGLGERLSGHGQRRAASAARSLLGVATGLLWAPCAGPILGLILTGAALSGASATTACLLLAYALGAATCLGLALLIGGKVFAAMKRSIGAGEWRPPGARRADPRRRRRHRARPRHPRAHQPLDRARPSPSRHRLAAAARHGRATMPRHQASAACCRSKARCRRSTAPSRWLNSPPLTREQLKRQGRAGRFLDLQLHQLHPLRARTSAPGPSATPRTGPGRDRRPRARIRVRDGSRQRPQGGRRLRHQLSGRARQ